MHELSKLASATSSVFPMTQAEARETFGEIRTALLELQGIATDQARKLQQVALSPTLTGHEQMLQSLRHGTANLTARVRKLEEDALADDAATAPWRSVYLTPKGTGWHVSERPDSEPSYWVPTLQEALKRADKEMGR